MANGGDNMVKKRKRKVHTRKRSHTYQMGTSKDIVGLVKFGIGAAVVTNVYAQTVSALKTP
jgi:hypothetical protein